MTAAINNALQIYSKVPDPVAYASEMAESVAAMVGCPLQQGRAMAMVCMIESISPLEAQRKYHFIQGKPSMKYDAMLREFNNAGGVHTILARTAEKAGIKLKFEGQEYEAWFTWDDAQQSRFPWKDPDDHSKGLKSNWSTATDRKIMLFARVVSDTLKVFCPKVVSGIYTPEEIQDIPGSVVVDATVVPTAEEVMRKMAEEAEEDIKDEQEPIASEEVTVDVPFDIEQPEVLGDGFATRAQVEAYKMHCERLDVSHEQQEGWLKKRHAEHPRNLSKEQIQEMIDKLAAVGN
jgi:hypothetical protein